MPPRRSSGFFTAPSRPEDEAARQREVEALLGSRRTVVQEIPAERITPNPFQARVAFEGLEELRDAILAQGFTSRLRVRPAPDAPGMFQLVYGERRLRAARMAGLALIPCEVAEHSDDELIEIGLAENIQRQDLNPLEEAQAFATFIRERGYSIRRLAERIGKDKGYVENRLNLLRAPEDVQAMVARRPDSMSAARELARVEQPAERTALIAQVVEGALSAAEVREIVREMTSSPAAPAGGPAALPDIDAAGGQSPPAPPAPGAQPHLPHTLQRAVRRDAAQLRAILDRWESLLTNPEAAQVVAPLLSEVIDQMERIARHLADEEPS